MWRRCQSGLPPVPLPATTTRCRRSPVQIDSTLWAVTLVGLVVVFTLDFFLAVRRPHAVTMREASLWTAVYVAAAIAFGLFIAAQFGSEYAGQFYAGWLTEYSLSVDNLFVFVIIMSRFARAAAVPAEGPAGRHRARADHARRLHRARRRGDRPVLLGVLHLRRVPDLHRVSTSSGMARRTTRSSRERADPVASSGCCPTTETTTATGFDRASTASGSSRRCSS